MQVRWGRRLLTLLVLAWLNLVLQPCAMAMAADAACPGCPPAHADRPMGHASKATHEHAAVPHDGMGSDAVAHEHNTDGGACGGSLVDCVRLGDINQCDRQQPLTPDHTTVWLAPPPMVSAQPGYRDPPVFSAGDAARLAGAFPPLNVLYCVYLD